VDPYVTSGDVDLSHVSPLSVRGSGADLYDTKNMIVKGWLPMLLVLFCNTGILENTHFRVLGGNNI
jgi:hypothetical protein